MRTPWNWTGQSQSIFWFDKLLLSIPKTTKGGVFFRKNYKQKKVKQKYFQTNKIGTPRSDECEDKGFYIY